MSRNRVSPMGLADNDVDTRQGRRPKSADELNYRPKQWWPRIEDDDGLIQQREARLWSAGKYRLDKDQVEGRWLEVSSYRLTPYNNMWVGKRKNTTSEASVTGVASKKSKDSGYNIIVGIGLSVLLE